MTILSRLSGRLNAQARAWRRRNQPAAAPPRTVSAPFVQAAPTMPSRRDWLKPGLVGAAGLMLLPTAGEAATPHSNQGYGVSVDDFGARGDGQSDDAPAFQAAVDSLGEAGGRILLGARHYRLASPVRITRAYVMFQGQGYAEAPGPAGGTWLLITTTGFSPFTVTNDTPGSETRGTTFRDLAVWQQQPVPTPNWAPTDYPFVFTLDQMSGGVEFDNIFLCNVTRGIHSRLVGRLNIGYIKGQCYDTMVFVEEAYDTCRVDYLESWFFVTSDVNVSDYMLAHYDPLRLGRVDGIYINNMFVFGARAGIHCIQQKAGCAQFMLGIFGCDHARYAVWFDHLTYDETFYSTINQITSNHVRWEQGGGSASLPGGCQIMMEHCTRLRLQVNMTSSAWVDGSVIEVSGTDNRLYIGMAWFSHFNRGNHTPPSPAFYLEDSASRWPNSVQLSQPVEIESASGGTVFGTNGDGVFRDPRGQFEAYLAGLPATAPAGSHRPYIREGAVRRD